MRSDAARAVGDRLDVGIGGRIDLRDHHDIGHAQHGFAGVVIGFVAGAQRIDQHDVQVGANEGKVVVAAVPQDDVGFLLRLCNDRGVIDARVDHRTRGQVRLVFLALLDRAVGGIEIGARREALHRLFFEVAVRHRVTNHRDPEALVPQQPCEPARGLRLAAAGAHRAGRDHRHARFEHGAIGVEQQEIRARGERDRGRLHHPRMADVAVGEHHLVDVFVAAQLAGPASSTIGMPSG